MAIQGKSGSGKTTLINVLTGIDRPTGGEVLVAGTPVHKLDEGQLAAWRGQTLGIVFQFFQLLPTLTVLENVRLPMDFCNRYRPAEREDRALELLELVGIGALADQLPGQLSGGQQQSAAIARALANDPQILVTDEPTGNLDSRTAEEVFELLHRLAGEGKTVVMVTHDDELAARAKRVVVIQGWGNRYELESFWVSLTHRSLMIIEAACNFDKSLKNKFRLPHPAYSFGRIHLVGLF